MTTRNPAPPSWRKLLGIDASPLSHRERLLSALGGFVGLLVVYWVSQALGPPPPAPLLIFSIGASTVLVFVVLGGEPVRALGFGFVLAPVLLNVLVLLAAAVVFNAFFPWRRYPVGLARRAAPTLPAGAGYAAISHEDFVFALTQMDSFIDVSEEDLLRIYDLATGRRREVAAGSSQTS